MKLVEYMGYELIEMVNSKQITIQEVLEDIIERINKFEPKLHSFVNLNIENALNKAKEYDKLLRKKKKLGRLFGLPLANKDLICIKNFPTTCCSRILHNFLPPYSATVITKLTQQDSAIHIGNTNMDEFAMGGTTENSCYNQTYNPWNTERVPGGSSGGSASAISSGEAVFALGSDTGGSVRCPASYCGVVGLKPTYGRVSRYGLIAFANSLDQIGPITKCVHDSALLLEIISGKDNFDSTSVDIKIDRYTDFLNNTIKNKIVGIPKEFFGEGIDAGVKENVMRSIEKLKDLGVSTMEVSIPHLEYTIATYYLICMSEASSNLARYDGLRYGKVLENQEGDIYDVFSKFRSEGFGAEVKRRIILGTYALSAGYYDMYYIKALKVRNLIKRDFQNCFKKCDILVSPTMPSTAFKIGEKIDNPLKMYMDDVLTCPVNLSGLPAISIPCGFDSDDLPIGIQFIGDYFDEKTIFNVAYQLEQELNIFRKIPSIS